MRLKQLVAGVLLVLLLSIPFPLALTRSQFDPRPSVVLLPGRCSGVLVSPVLVVTASHCVSAPGERSPIAFPMSPSQEVVGGVVVWDSAFLANQDISLKYLDLALISIPEVLVTPLSLDLRVLDPAKVYRAFGYPDGLPILRGVNLVFKRIDPDDDLLEWQSDGPAINGHSGGPVISEEGLVGIVVAYLRRDRTIWYTIGQEHLRWSLDHYDTHGPMPKR